MAQYFHLDDSGDPGMANVQGSSSHFVLAMIQLPERAPLSVLANVRAKLHLQPAYEFKYYKSTAIQKTIFFETVRGLGYRVRAVFVDKLRLPSTFSNITGQDFTIEFVTGLTLRASELDIANDVLVVDGATIGFLRALRIRLSRECRAHNRVRPFRQIVGGDSKREDGLQLADMTAGAISNHLLGEEKEFYPLFVEKMSDLWIAP